MLISDAQVELACQTEQQRPSEKGYIVKSVIVMLRRAFKEESSYFQP